MSATKNRRIVYHVAGENWSLGEPLLCWDELRQRGFVTADDWHWDEVHVGHDGDMVCVYDTLDSAIGHYERYGGAAILAIAIAPESSTEAGFHGFGCNPWSGRHEPVYTKRSVERFDGFNFVPAAWITSAFSPVAEGSARESARVAEEAA